MSSLAAFVGLNTTASVRTVCGFLGPLSARMAGVFDSHVRPGHSTSEAAKHKTAAGAFSKRVAGKKAKKPSQLAQSSDEEAVPAGKPGAWKEDAPAGCLHRPTPRKGSVPWMQDC